MTLRISLGVSNLLQAWGICLPHEMDRIVWLSALADACCMYTRQQWMAGLHSNRIERGAGAGARLHDKKPTLRGGECDLHRERAVLWGVLGWRGGMYSICFPKVLSLQAVNLMFWLIPNAYILANRCDFTAPIVNASVVVRWTCWNSVRNHFHPCVSTKSGCSSYTVHKSLFAPLYVFILWLPILQFNQRPYNV